MTVDEQRFHDELEAFRGGVEEASQFLYAHLTIARRARESQRVLQRLRENPLFWLTVQAALQRSCLIALGRVFDQNSPHNLDRLIGLAARGRSSIFSREALRLRKRAGGPEPTWLAQYVAEAYVPTAEDFREMRRRVARLRRGYADYRGIRDWFAHAWTTQQAEIDRLYTATRVRDLQRLVLDLLALHQALWAVFVDGRRPTYRRPRSHPARGVDAWKSITTDRPHERIVLQAERVLAQASRPARPASRRRRAVPRSTRSR